MVGFNTEIDSILKQVLIENSCSFGKYLSKIDYLNSNSGLNTEFFITPVATRSLKKVLVITRMIDGKWYDNVRDLQGFIRLLFKEYNLVPEEYEMILHTYFSSINFEQFYNIRFDSKELIEKITITEIEKILS